MIMDYVIDSEVKSLNSTCLYMWKLRCSLRWLSNNYFCSIISPPVSHWNNLNSREVTCFWQICWDFMTYIQFYMKNDQCFLSIEIGWISFFRVFSFIWSLIFLNSYIVIVLKNPAKKHVLGLMRLSPKHLYLCWNRTWFCKVS